MAMDQGFASEVSSVTGTPRGGSSVSDEMGSRYCHRCKVFYPTLVGTKCPACRTVVSFSTRVPNVAPSLAQKMVEKAEVAEAYEKAERLFERMDELRERAGKPSPEDLAKNLSMDELIADAQAVVSDAYQTIYGSVDQAINRILGSEDEQVRQDN